MLRPLRLAITTGDPDGIGPEVVAKALQRIGPQKDVHFFIWRNADFPKKDYQRLKKEFRVKAVRSWAEALTVMPNAPKELIDINSSKSPAHWVEEAAHACLFGHLDGIATAPLSKTTIVKAGFSDIGHTDILKRVAGIQNVHMTFIGNKFHVMLVTGHVPIQEIATALTTEKMQETCEGAFSLRQFLMPKKKAPKPIAILGLNPHCGEDGLLGGEEKKWMGATIAELNKKHKDAFVGPLVPDSAFTPNLWPGYSIYVAMYHDQGLIPFKTVHGREGVHLSWGLPFVRTSVDHGTAFDIAGQDKADYTSMKMAIEWAIELCRRRYNEGKS